MKVFVEIEEAAERLEDLIELALLGDEIVICRDGTPAATFIPIEKKEEAMDKILALATEGRKNVPVGATSNHDDVYDEHGLPI
ncbi:Antitoxin of toxin-antitoxin stability system [Agrobacterium sp. DSM 25558]|uniref:type II toxin-antitoxin system Phd/YefM family antitoxin n=1 Tax=Agrobacterium sp. DSM 25558 TaxID=1907665 RepID=UPI0009725EE1|nr:prevent-host-death family protein [Agrobacterium sp. DSM 25558]SCX23153.1 Antitoxin of toxin-antitoxin stability system [Agrobacterium sp. DSM 25558]